jgi:hypothetical protein
MPFWYERTYTDKMPAAARVQLAAAANSFSRSVCVDATSAWYSDRLVFVKLKGVSDMRLVQPERPEPERDDPDRYRKLHEEPPRRPFDEPERRSYDSPLPIQQPEPQPPDKKE